MEYFYSASVMKYGLQYGKEYCRWWHRFYNFPKYPFVTKTLTLSANTGTPWKVFKWGNSVYNSVGLDNIGIGAWMVDYAGNNPDAIVSLFGNDDQIAIMVDMLSHVKIRGIELNFSCPNIPYQRNRHIPISNHPIYLKLGYNSDPWVYDLDKVKGIRLNSVKSRNGTEWAVSGEKAKEKNWWAIETLIRSGINVAGCSFQTIDDLKALKNLGCEEIGIGSIMLTNPSLIGGKFKFKRGH